MWGFFIYLHQFNLDYAIAATFRSGGINKKIFGFSQNYLWAKAPFGLFSFVPRHKCRGYFSNA